MISSCETEWSEPALASRSISPRASSSVIAVFLRIETIVWTAVSITGKRVGGTRNAAKTPIKEPSTSSDDSGGIRRSNAFLCLPGANSGYDRMAV